MLIFIFHLPFILLIHSSLSFFSHLAVLAVLTLFSSFHFHSIPFVHQSLTMASSVLHPDSGVCGVTDEKEFGSASVASVARCSLPVVERLHVHIRELSTMPLWFLRECQNESLTPGNGPTDICNKQLYIGDVFHATDQQTMKDFTHAVNCTPDAPNAFPDNVVYHRVPVRDDEQEDVGAKLDDAADFIHDAITSSENAKVIVHCIQGVSRSVTVAIAYLLKYQRDVFHTSLYDALAHVRERRGPVRPNNAFYRTLRAFEMRLRRGAGDDGDLSPIPGLYRDCVFA